MLLAVAALAIPTAAPAATACADADLMPTSANVAAVRGATLCLLNGERAIRGLKALTSSGELRVGAQRYSNAMVRLDFFDHVSPPGGTLLGRVLHRTVYLRDAGHYWLGENLAWGTGDHASPRGMVAAWMQAPPHRMNILNPRYRHIGIGIAIGAPQVSADVPAATYTAHFGRRTRR